MLGRVSIDNDEEVTAHGHDIVMTNDNEIAASMRRCGVAPLGQRLTQLQCRDIRAMFDDDRLFRSRISMARHGFGQGEYKYFAYPLPPLVQSLRESFYSELVPLTDGWGSHRYPFALLDFLSECHALAQRRPTPLLLRYVPGDYNCLHQDLYGALHFPMQVVVLLSEPGSEFTGGEFVTRESRSSHDEVAVHALEQGEAMAFASSNWHARTPRGAVKAELRHGVSPLRTGERYALGIIFHDAT